MSDFSINPNIAKAKTIDTAFYISEKYFINLLDFFNIQPHKTIHSQGRPGLFPHFQPMLLVS